MSPKDGDMKSGFAILKIIDGKLLFFKKGFRCSWHYHKVKDETFYLQSGLLSLYHGWDTEIATAKFTGDSNPYHQFHIPVGLKPSA